ncbi:MAG: FtsX-like permease family protein [Deltaproteobacteria bacterium]
MLLASVGLYALVSYTTARKTREFGIRSALGSPPLQLLWLIMRGGLLWLGLGSVLGFLGAWALGRLLALGLPGGNGFDVRVCAIVALALALAGSLASFIPARRAVRASPATALRYE